VSQSASAATPTASLSVEDRARLERATELHGAGDLDGAEALYAALLTAPGAPVERLQFVLGMLAEARGDKAKALAHYDLSAEAGFVSTELAPRRAELLRRAGRTPEALAAYDLCLSLGLDRPDLHHARGVVLAALGRHADALAAYDAAAVGDPENPKVQGNRGVALEALGRSDEAVAAYRAALVLDPGYRHAHHNLGSVLLKQEKFEPAAQSLERALRIDPTQPETWNLLGVARCSQDRHAEALVCVDHAIELRPAYAEAHNNRSIALRWLRRFDEAIESASRAHALDPTMAAALNSRAVALMRLNRHEEALFDLNAALALKPRFASAILNRGSALEVLGEVDAAMADFREALRLEPEIPDGEFNLGLAYLRLGDYREGFSRYERRWDRKAGPYLPHPRSQLWQGQDLHGKKLLITAEQGFGDMIQFCRFAADVAAQGARVVLQVQPPLKRLMQRLAGPERVIGLDDPTPPFDLYCPAMNLPRALNLDLAGVRRGRYLFASDDDIAVWRDALGEDGRLRVGLAWTGNPGHENDHNRSATLDAFAPLFDRGFDLVSLQKQHEPDEHRALEAAGVRAFDSRLHDFSDTAGLIGACDAVVAVDTSVAHLAAALGKPTFILLPKVSDWRWMNTRVETPWYPTARLCRQTAARDWSRPLAEAIDGLEGLGR